MTKDLLSGRAIIHQQPAPIRRLGQHFLIDPNIVRKIIALAELDRHNEALEIGPGRGILTEALCRACGRVTAIEIDPRLHAQLSKTQAEFPNLELILADAMTYPLENLARGTVVVANLPYYLSTPLLFRLLEERDRFPRMVLMLQTEVADRLVAKAGSHNYGVLSVMAQYAAEVTEKFKVSAQCFRPRPDVTSSVVLVRTRQRRELGQEEEPKFATLVKAAFAHRRKTLVNSLRDEGYDDQRVQDGLARLNLAPAVRAEVLSFEQFIALARLIATSADERATRHGIVR